MLGGRLSVRGKNNYKKQDSWKYMENKQFDFNKFKTEFSKILSIGINELLITKSEYRKHVENLLDVVQSENEQVSKSFGFILSDQFIHNTNKVIIVAVGIRKDGEEKRHLTNL